MKLAISKHLTDFVAIIVLIAIAAGAVDAQHSCCQRCPIVRAIRCIHESEIGHQQHSARPRAWRVAEAAAIGGRGKEVLQ